MSIEEKHKELMEHVKKSISSEGVTCLNHIWGVDTGRQTVIQQLINTYNCVTVCNKSDSSYAGKNVYDYSIAPSDLVVELRILTKFSDKIDVIILDNFDYCAMSGGDAGIFHTYLENICEELGIPTILVLSYYNKPSYTERLFHKGTLNEKVPSWEINKEYEPLKSRISDLESWALLRYGCQ